MTGSCSRGIEEGMHMMHTIYCGGSFCFDFRQEDYRQRAGGDYRARLLGSADPLLQRSDGVRLHDHAVYAGPFYFESDGMVDEDVVRSEIAMVRRCSDAIFLLDAAACPGTICELTMASTLGKAVHIFYIRRPEDEETESALHTPCWYPILHSRQINPHTTLHPCTGMEDAIGQIRALVESWRDA